MPDAYEGVLRTFGRMAAARGLHPELNPYSELDLLQLANGIASGFLEYIVEGPGGHIYLTQWATIEVRERDRRRYEIEQRVMRLAGRRFSTVDTVVAQAFQDALRTLPNRLSVRSIITKINGW